MSCSMLCQIVIIFGGPLIILRQASVQYSLEYSVKYGECDDDCPSPVGKQEDSSPGADGKTRQLTVLTLIKSLWLSTLSVVHSTL